ncbi:MAG: NAD(P)-dependent oxidoreductase [Eggerthellaceae bacterium]|nr:NAD(P)-dependent oxidoreductase [Eggerthellaceae bacterium]
MSGSYAFMGHEAIGSHVEERLAKIGWTRVEDVADAEVAFTYFISTSLLEDAYFDDGGLVKNAVPGTVLVDLSPSTPSFAREISAVATVNDLVFVEAPLAVLDPFGQVEFRCFVACEEPDRADDVLALLDAIAVSVEQRDAVGAAQLARATNTIRMAANIVGAVESDALVRSVREVASAETEIDDEFAGGFPIELLLAEVVAAMTTADDVDLILPQLEAAMHLLELMVVIGGADMNPKALSLLYREEAASAAHGLDWTRAEGLYAEHDHGYDHDAYDYGDGIGFPGGFGGYSAN